MCVLLSKIQIYIYIHIVLHAPYKVEAVHLLHVYMVPCGCKPRKLPALGCGPLGMHGNVILATGICLRYCKPFSVRGRVNYLLDPRLPARKKKSSAPSSHAILPRHVACFTIIETSVLLQMSCVTLQTLQPMHSPTFCMFYYWNLAA